MFSHIRCCLVGCVSKLVLPGLIGSSIELSALIEWVVSFSGLHDVWLRFETSFLGFDRILPGSAWFHGVEPSCCCICFLYSGLYWFFFFTEFYWRPRGGGGGVRWRLLTGAAPMSSDAFGRELRRYWSPRAAVDVGVRCRSLFSPPLRFFLVWPFDFAFLGQSRIFWVFFKKKRCTASFRRNFVFST